MWKYRNNYSLFISRRQNGFSFENNYHKWYILTAPNEALQLLRLSIKPKRCISVFNYIDFIFKQSVCNRPSTFIFNCIKRQKRSYDRPKARTYSEANIPWIINRTLAEYELSIHRNNSQKMVFTGIFVEIISHAVYEWADQ